MLNFHKDDNSKIDPIEEMTINSSFQYFEEALNEEALNMVERYHGKDQRASVIETVKQKLTGKELEIFQQLLNKIENKSKRIFFLETVEPFSEKKTPTLIKHDITPLFLKEKSEPQKVSVKEEKINKEKIVEQQPEIKIIEKEVIQKSSEPEEEPGFIETCLDGMNKLLDLRKSGKGILAIEDIESGTLEVAEENVSKVEEAIKQDRTLANHKVVVMNPQLYQALTQFVQLRLELLIESLTNMKEVETKKVEESKESVVSKKGQVETEVPSSKSTAQTQLVKLREEIALLKTIVLFLSTSKDFEKEFEKKREEDKIKREIVRNEINKYELKISSLKKEAVQLIKKSPELKGNFDLPYNPAAA